MFLRRTNCIGSVKGSVDKLEKVEGILQKETYDYPRRIGRINDCDNKLGQVVGLSHIDEDDLYSPRSDWQT